MAPSTRLKRVLKSLRTQPSVAVQSTVGGLATGDPDEDVVVLGTLVSRITSDQHTGVTPMGHPGTTCHSAWKSKPHLDSSFCDKI